MAGSREEMRSVQTAQNIKSDVQSWVFVFELLSTIVKSDCIVLICHVFPPEFRQVRTSLSLFFIDHASVGVRSMEHEAARFALV